MVNPSHFDLQSLRVFLMAAELGSLTKAAERAAMTLSAVSKRIAELEKTVDCALFVRRPRGLDLTPAGRGLAEHARQILDQVNRMASEIGDYAVGVRGHVRLWVTPSAVIQFLPADLSAFLAANPGVRIGLEERMSAEIVDAVAAGRADIGIFAENIPAPLLDKVRYRQDKLVVLVPPHHALARRRKIAFADTLKYDYVGLNQGSSLLARMVDEAAAAERALRLTVQVSSFDGICRMIEAGLGIGILPEAAVRAEILGAGLHAVELTDAWANRTLWVGVKAGVQLAPEAAKLYAFLQASAPGAAA
ncbi:LysR family transcriptional regulator [Pandoraea sp.]|uniref:LysR family transcriptional regulator n=1 Tax=Pandoraea sp. TaxID=1883445 RepID=UPI001224CCEF|nr:LysR family transcriptional regulator [Pandoraea sp.]TAL52182.1 MAG: LysR family transcriptional regulator [Pandoraea sp.]TAM17269.1 MAG: LysR family transcriptional regulator [Pandoraea sp.]